MVAGHLHEKNGYYYIILNLTDSAGKRKPKGVSMSYGIYPQRSGRRSS